MGPGKESAGRKVPGSEPRVGAQARGPSLLAPSVRQKPLAAEVIAEVPAGGVSGGAGARRLHAGGCARSQLCRRSGRNRSCSRSARSYTVARAGSALCTHRCRHSARGRRPAGSRQDTRTPLRPVAAHSGRSRSGTRLNPPRSCPLLAGASPAAGGSCPRRNCSHSVTSGTGTRRRAAGTGGTGLPILGPGDSSSRRR